MNKIQELLTTNFHCSDLASVLLHINTETWSHHAVIIYISTMTTTCIREYKEENTNMSVTNIYGKKFCILFIYFYYYVLADCWHLSWQILISFPLLSLYTTSLTYFPGEYYFVDFQSTGNQLAWLEGTIESSSQWYPGCIFHQKFLMWRFLVFKVLSIQLFSCVTLVHTCLIWLVNFSLSFTFTPRSIRLSLTSGHLRFLFVI